MFSFILYKAIIDMITYMQKVKSSKLLSYAISQKKDAIKNIWNKTNVGI